MNVSKETIITASKLIAPYLINTPLIHAKNLSDIFGAKIFLKLENLQYTHSFKVRGAFNKILSLSEEQKINGVVAASTGNHGAAVAFAGKNLGVPVTVFVPKNAVETKLQNIQKYQATIISVGDDCGDAELAAREYAQENKLFYVSPYNDEQIICGQGTIAVEIFDALNQVDAIYVPVGGGGLIGGVATYTKAVSPNTQLIGCMPENSPVMYACVKAGKIIAIDTFDTISDATAGNIDQDSVTFPMCQALVDDYFLASENKIKDGLKLLYKEEKIIAEGATGNCIAALIDAKEAIKNKTIVAIISGANVSEKVLKEIV